MHVVGVGFCSSDGQRPTTRHFDQKMGIVRVYHTNAYRYAMNQHGDPNGGVTGWFSRDMIRPNV